MASGLQLNQPNPLGPCDASYEFVYVSHIHNSSDFVVQYDHGIIKYAVINVKKTCSTM